MLNLENLHKTWSIIEKNKCMKTDAQVINFLSGSSTRKLFL